MSNPKISKLLSAVFLLAGSLLATQASAHELRNIGDDYWIQVGGHVEPPYTNVKNGIDVYIVHNDHPEKKFPDGIVILDTKKGDKVDVSAFGLVTKTDDYNSPIIRLFPLNNVWKDAVIEGYLDHYQENAFVFKKATTYGFYVEGTIQRVGFKPKKFGEKFICEKGSQDTTYKTAFECITDAPSK
jgi:hypothetical protein